MRWGTHRGGSRGVANRLIIMGMMMIISIRMRAGTGRARQPLHVMQMCTNHTGYIPQCDMNDLFSITGRRGRGRRRSSSISTRRSIHGVIMYSNGRCHYGAFYYYYDSKVEITSRERIMLRTGITFEIFSDSFSQSKCAFSSSFINDNNIHYIQWCGVRCGDMCGGCVEDGWRMEVVK